MAAPSGQMQTKIASVCRKQKYKELIEQGSKVSKYRRENLFENFRNKNVLKRLLGDNLENHDVLDTFQNILDIVHNCESLSSNFVKDGKIENAADYLLDAQVLKMSHDLMGSTADKMGNNDFSEDEFIVALTNLFTIENGEHNFNRLAEIAVGCCRTSNFSVPMLGTFEFEAAPRLEKPKKERQRAKANVGAFRAPENVKQLSKSDKGAEKINIARTEIQRVCRQRKTDCIPYFELICHPKSFMKSVDVAFQISFLVRDGFLGLKKINDEPFVYLFDPDPTAQQSQRANYTETVQCVMTINTQLWKEKIKKFGIKSPLLELEHTENEVEDDVETDSD